MGNRKDEARIHAEAALRAAPDSPHALLGVGLVLWFFWLVAVGVGHVAGSAVRLPPGHPLYFAAVAIINEIVWRTQSDDTWVAFRGGLWIASAVFGVWQVFFIMKHLIKDDEPTPVSPDTGL